MTEQDAWEAKKHLLAPALDGSYDLDDVWHEISEHRAQFWYLPNSAVVTQILEFPRRKVFRVWLAGGDLDELRFAMQECEGYAKSRGCDAIEIDGRKGWARVFPGFDKQRVTLAKEVTK